MSLDDALAKTTLLFLDTAPVIYTVSTHTCILLMTVSHFMQPRSAPNTIYRSSMHFRRRPPLQPAVTRF